MNALPLPQMEDVHILSKFIHSQNLQEMKDYLETTLTKDDHLNLLHFHNSSHDTALMKACIHGNLEMENILISYGAGINESNDGITPLVKAIWYNRMETVTYLLELGVNVNQSIEGLFITFSPLMIAGEVNKIEIMKLLLNAGANINFQTREDGFTTLMRVCSLGHVEAVRLLLRYGADVEILNHDQKKAIDIAKERKQLEIVELLLWGPDHDPHEKDEVEIQKEILWEKNFLVNQRRLSESDRRMIVVASREGGCEEDEEGDDDNSLVYARTTTYHRYADMNSDSDYDSN